MYHAEYAASVGVDGEPLAGSLPVKQLKPVQAWAAIHENELYAAWVKAVRNEPLGKIEPLKVSGVRPMDGHRLWVRFNTGEIKVFDVTPLLRMPAFAPLRDDSLFRSVCINYGVPVWQDGEIDIAPETLYQQGNFAEERA